MSSSSSFTFLQMSDIVELDENQYSDEPREIFSPTLTSINEWIERVHVHSVESSIQINDKLTQVISLLTTLVDKISPQHSAPKANSAAVEPTVSQSLRDVAPIHIQPPPHVQPSIQVQFDNPRVGPASRPPVNTYKRPSFSNNQNPVPAKMLNKPCIFCMNPYHGPKTCYIRSIPIRKQLLSAQGICQICGSQLSNDNHTAICHSARCKNHFCKGVDHGAWTCPNDRSLNA